MSNTPVREIPYRTTMLLTGTDHEVDVEVFRKVGNDLYVRIDDERAGEQNGCKLILTVTQ